MGFLRAEEAPGLRKSGNRVAGDQAPSMVALPFFRRAATRAAAQIAPAWTIR
ncbi:MAG: hypothetical protein ABWX93_02290 [Pseudoxanthomonas sp.]